MSIIIMLTGALSAIAISILVLMMIGNNKQKTITKNMALLGITGFGLLAVYGLLKKDFITVIPALVMFGIFLFKLITSNKG